VSRGESDRTGRDAIYPIHRGHRGPGDCVDAGDACRMAHNPARTGNLSARRYVTGTRRDRQSKPASGALRGACSDASHALAAPIARAIALAALAALGLSGDPVHEPVHGLRLHHRVRLNPAQDAPRHVALAAVAEFADGRSGAGGGCSRRRRPRRASWWPRRPGG